jgi:hypothetical protein
MTAGQAGMTSSRLATGKPEEPSFLKRSLEGQDEIYEKAFSE